MITCGLTGGCGSGKTTIANMFVKIGVPVFNSDKCARDSESNPVVQEGYKKLLGDDIFVDGVMDRPKMRKLVFTDKAKLIEVNKFMIPYVRNAFLDFCEKHKDQPYVILESAILFETKNYKNFDYIISVIADEETRIERVIKRDGLTRKGVEDKLNMQTNDTVREELSDFLIFNNDIYSISLANQVEDANNHIYEFIQKKIKYYESNSKKS